MSRLTRLREIGRHEKFIVYEKVGSDAAPDDE